jgi:cytochrome c2
MADRGDTHYKVSTLNMWFLLSSGFLLVATAWMVIDDWNAPWKKYQAEFRKIDEVRTRDRIESAEMQAQAESAAGIGVLLAEATSRLDARQDEVSGVEQELHEAKGKLFEVSENTKKAKQNLAWERYLIEEHRNHENEPTYGEERLREFTRVFVELQAEEEQRAATVDEITERLADLNEEVTSLAGKKKAAQGGLTTLQKKLNRLAPEAPTEKLANVLRDFPGLDFVDPRNKVKKQVLSDLSFELNFTKGARIDMCQTCHEAADMPGYTSDIIVDGEPIANPYLTHPNLDLYLSAKSPHPVTEMGCTICHRGSGQALDFIRADHRPVGGEQMEEWRKKYHWHKQHHWDYPMLDSDFIEASCVQCHKGSMELIAEAAPTVSEGYRLFEERGCYSCHKVEWFPTTRKPGPTLKNLQAKLDRTWVDSWVANPTNFRPSTKMPRIFHLSNYEPEAVITTSEWGEGREMLGQEWTENMIASITAYLFNAAPKRAADPMPIPGDADRGRESYRLAGCLACHNMAGYPGQTLPTIDLAFQPNNENEHGPNLRGVATKLNRDWLYQWLMDPKAYWPETRMPDLGLSQQEAADITAYIMDDPDGIFRDVTDVWELEESTYDAEVLREMAREFFSRLGRTELARRFAGENPEFRWDREEDLLLAVGERQIGHNGCFSCHLIGGFEETSPIGVELTNWGSKTVDKLAWEFRVKIMAHENGWDLGTREEFKHYRENWIEEKLKNPRIFDEQKVKSPLELTRMPQFGLSDSEILAISNFVVGLVDDEVALAEMDESPADAAMDYGMRVVRQQNCMACHVVEPGRVQFHDEEGVLHDIAAEPVIFDGLDMPPKMEDIDQFRQYIADYEAEFEELEDIGFRLLEVAPDFGLTGESIYITKDQLVGLKSPQGGDFVRVVADYYLNGIEMFDPEATGDQKYYSWTYGPDGAVADVDGELRSYHDQGYDKVRWTFAPPVLLDEGSKVQRSWFYSFLMDPFPIRQQLRVHMPAFNITESESAAVANYFAHKAEQESPASYARAMRASAGITPKRSLAGKRPWPELTNQIQDKEVVTAAELAPMAGLAAKTILGIEDGSKPDTEASFDKLEVFGDSIGFSKSGAVNPSIEAILQQSASYHSLEGLGREVAFKGVNCFTCHWLNGTGPTQLDSPIAWAPDLGLTRDRLRPDWTRDWLWNPNLIYPGTSMAANFASSEPQYQAQYPDSTNAQQIEAVLDWLFNFDRTESADNN